MREKKKQQETILSQPGNHLKIYCYNKGFIKHALIHGVSVVPVFGFGMNDVFEQKRAPQIIATFTQRWFGGLYPQIPWGSFGPLLPYAKPVVQVVGNPVPMPKLPHPTKAEIEFHHGRFYASLAQLIRDSRKEAGFDTLQVDFEGLEVLSVKNAQEEAKRTELVSSKL